MTKEAQLIQKLLAWLRNRVKASGTKGIVLGLSGGLDSAVCARLAQLALGRNHCLALFLPCASLTADASDAQLIARHFKIKTQRLDLTRTFKTLTTLLPPANAKTVANLKPRLRMLTLYYFANKLNYLVLGTGNKSELMTGYFTKYGDGGVDLLPLGNLLKRDVRALAEYLRIPQRIIDKPPSAGLWRGQTDEGELGITYHQLDTILSGGNDKKKSCQLTQSATRKVKILKQASEHKRCLPEIFKP
jgi:NAD+ synthase